jgi:hypothetical protein
VARAGSIRAEARIKWTLDDQWAGFRPRSRSNDSRIRNAKRTFQLGN